MAFFWHFGLFEPFLPNYFLTVTFSLDEKVTEDKKKADLAKC